MSVIALITSALPPDADIPASRAGEVESQRGKVLKGGMDIDLPIGSAPASQYSPTPKLGRAESYEGFRNALQRSEDQHPFDDRY